MLGSTESRSNYYAIQGVLCKGLVCFSSASCLSVFLSEVRMLNTELQEWVERFATVSEKVAHFLQGSLHCSGSYLWYRPLSCVHPSSRKGKKPHISKRSNRGWEGSLQCDHAGHAAGRHATSAPSADRRGMGKGHAQIDSRASRCLGFGLLGFSSPDAKGVRVSGFRSCASPGCKKV